MRSFLIAICACVASVCSAQPEVMPPLICSGVTTSAVAVTATSQNLSGYLKGCQVAVSPASGTCTVTIASSGTLGSRTIFSGSFVGTRVLKEVVQLATNGVVVNSFDYPILASDAIVVSAVSATVSNDNLTVTVKPIIDRTR